MPQTPRSRDRYKNLLAFLTGAAAFGSFVGTGAATGMAAHATGTEEQAKAQEKADAARIHYAAALRARQRPAWTPKVTVTEPRPQKTIVERVSGPAAAAVGSGGSVSSSGAAAAPAPAASGSTSSSSSAPPPAPAAPAPAPAPAPSSGS